MREADLLALHERFPARYPVLLESVSGVEPLGRYDVLFALTVLAESELISDPRCSEALDMLEAKRLSDGGFPAEAKFYRVSSAHPGGGSSSVSWGPTSRRLSNEWVSCAALVALTA